MSESDERVLRAPDWAAVDTIWRNPLPFVLWPVCGRPLLAHWLEAATRAGVARVVIVADDRPHVIRDWLERGNYWSRPIEVVPSSQRPRGEGDRPLTGLPPAGECGEISDGQALLAHWFSLHGAALATRSADGLLIDREVTPGVWVGPGARIDPSARLVAPCWIGARARVGAGCQLGPGAYVGRNAIVDEQVEITQAIVCDHTYVGRFTHLSECAVQGGQLLSWRHGVAVRIAEDFIVSDLRPRASAPGWGERLVAAAGWLPACLAGWVCNRGARAERRVVADAQGRTFPLATWARGPLILRRARWLSAVVAGRLRLVGILPRTPAEWDALPPEVRPLLEGAPAGILALSDLHGCHDPADPDEWMHASYQAGAAEQAGQKQARRAAWVIARKVPLP